MLKKVDMAQGKKSFIAYSDWKDTFDELSDEDAGVLIKHIFSYVNDDNPTTENNIVRAVFAGIKSTLKRDLEKWDAQLKQRVEAGIKSGQSRRTKSNDRSTTVNEPKRKRTVSVSDSVSGSVLLKKETKDIYRQFAHLSLSAEDFEKLNAKWGKVLIDEILDSIENYKGNKNYTSLYLTANKWLQKEYPVKTENTTSSSGTNQRQPNYADDDY